MAEPTDPPIVVSGGSVTLEYDSSQFTKKVNGKHYNADKRIRSVEITGDGIDPIKLDIPNGQVTVTIRYGNK